MTDMPHANLFFFLWQGSCRKQYSLRASHLVNCRQNTMPKSMKATMHFHAMYSYAVTSGPCIQAESSMTLTVQTKPRQLLVLHNRKTVEPVELS